MGKIALVYRAHQAAVVIVVATSAPLMLLMNGFASVYKASNIVMGVFLLHVNDNYSYANCITRVVYNMTALNDKIIDDKCKSMARIDLSIVKVYVKETLNSLSSSGSASEDPKSRVVKACLGFGDNAKKWLSGMLRLRRGLLDRIAAGYRGAGFGVVELLYRLVTPGLVGAGSGLFKPVFEVGLSVDPLTGLPYYPGSGVKGAVRALAERAWGPVAAEAVFGSSGEAGSAGAVVFSDMYPVGCGGGRCSVFRGLVVNPHYHSGGEPVEDELHAYPVPVVHIGVEEGLVFGLVIAAHPARSIEALQALSGMDCGGVEEAYRGLCEASRRIASSSGGDPVRGLLSAVLLVVDEAFARGIAARASKGYNVFEPVDENSKLGFEVVAYSFEPPSSREEQRRREGRGQKGASPGPRRGGRGGYGRGPRGGRGRGGAGWHRARHRRY